MNKKYAAFLSHIALVVCMDWDELDGKDNYFPMICHYANVENVNKFPANVAELLMHPQVTLITGADFSLLNDLMRTL